MHNHKVCCKHEHIKYCPKCQKPYCEDCGKEWAEPCNLNHYYPWTISTPSVSWEIGDPHCYDTSSATVTITNCAHQEG